MIDPTLFDAILAERAPLAARVNATAWQQPIPALGV